MDRLAGFCRRWQVTEMSLFGSVLRDDFRPDSDVDVLISLARTARHSVLELAQMRDELAEILDRPVDLVEKEAVRNPFRRRAIMAHREVIYAS